MVNLTAVSISVPKAVMYDASYATHTYITRFKK
jgi:hypothetical protein